MFDAIDLDLDAFNLDHDAPEETGEEILAAILCRPVGTFELAEVLA